MKSALKTVFATIILALVVVSCSKVENILPKKDGMWKMASLTIRQDTNNVLFHTSTQSDSLPTVFFDKDLNGYTQDFGSTVKHNFTWSVNSDNDQISVLDSGATKPTVFDITDASKNAETWTNVSIDTFLTVIYKTTGTYVLERK